MDIEDGSFNLFVVDPKTAVRQLTYAFRFTGADGKKYYLYGYKSVKDEPGFDIVKDMTTLYTTIYEGVDDSGPVYGRGQIFFKMADLPAMAASMKVIGRAWFWDKLAVKTSFLDFAYGQLRDTYLRGINPFYDTEYQNLVLSGQAGKEGGAESKFFFVSGVHAKDFPWGDGELFWDVLLAVKDGEADYRRFALTERVIKGLHLSVAKNGTYTYKGFIYELMGTNCSSFSDMQEKKDYLKEWQVEIDIQFDCHAFDVTPLPFLTANNLLAELTTKLKIDLEKWLPSTHLLGIFITPNTVKVKTGKIKMTRDQETIELDIVPEKTFGEAENTTFKNVKEPTMLYGYICGVEPEKHLARVQMHANTLQNDPEWWIKNKLDSIIGAFVSHVASKEMVMHNDKITIRDLNPESDPKDRWPDFIKLGEPVIQINNDQYPTADFLRRIIEVKDPADGTVCLALEEDMDTMRLEAIDSDKKAVVAAIHDDDPVKALDEVLKQTGFFDILEEKFKASGKSRDDFSIIIKPNFMFAYNKLDRTTYTDPALVEHLVSRIREKQFKKLSVVEAQSTYGQFFDHRSVRDVAGYLGFNLDGANGYEVVDLTLDKWEYHHLGPHLGYAPIPYTWRDADFRISFAKNKTHAYAYYTLTLKNIYGSLPLANKFLEYHCDRDIYYTTIEYLSHFPMDFGLIDAHLSADGPFGIFADPIPNRTHTMIGGNDLVAVDWVASTKMGLDPEISEYMKLAVKAFGKPEITLYGDRSRYRPWLNVPILLALFTNYGLDASHYFGNLLYMSAAYADTDYFTFKKKGEFIKLARDAFKPLQRAVFLQTGGKVTVANKMLNKFFEWLGE